MKGRELIEYIQFHHAEDMLICVQFRDGGGIYNGADDVTPLMGHVDKINEAEDYNEYDVTYKNVEINAIIL